MQSGECYSGTLPQDAPELGTRVFLNFLRTLFSHADSDVVDEKTKSFSIPWRLSLRASCLHVCLLCVFSFSSMNLTPLCVRAFVCVFLFFFVCVRVRAVRYGAGRYVDCSLLQHVRVKYQEEKIRALRGLLIAPPLFFPLNR